MPQSSTITLVERDTTEHAFSPRSEAGGVFHFAKPGANGVPIAEAKLSVSLRDTPANKRVRLKLTQPKVVTETINGVDNPKKVWENTANVEFTFSSGSSTAERETLIGLIASALGSDQPVLDSVFKDLENLY